MCLPASHAFSLMHQQSPNSEPVYVISVAARLAGLPCWVLRVLDQEEIVVPARTDSNRRLYSDQDIAILARVRHLTEERGVNIAGVKVILEIELDRDHHARIAGMEGLPASSQAISVDAIATAAVRPAFDRPDVEDDGIARSTALALAGANSLAPYDTKK